LRNLSSGIALIIINNDDSNEIGDEMRTIAVMGTGYVGLVSGTCFAEKGNRVICCDIDTEKIDRLHAGEIPIYEPGLEELVQHNKNEGRLTFTTDISQAILEAEIIYIAVGTPMSETGAADLSYVRQAARTIGEHINGYKVIVNKSTVPIGTGRLVKEIIGNHLIHSGIPFDVVSNPEFLREGCAVSDCLNMERAVIGADSDRAIAIITELHEAFHTKVFVTDIESAELIKYAANAFLATKISFINDIAKLCEQVGASVTHVAEGMGMDSRIGKGYLQAGVGYGGSCFPKDTQALVHTASEYGLDFQLIRSAIETNEKQSMLVVDKLVHILGDLREKKIAVFGLAFKPDTDDIRYAPSLRVIPELLKLGAKVQAFDPIAGYKAQKLLDDDVVITTDLYVAAKGAEACIILTEWKHVLEMDFIKLKNLLKLPIIIDGRNCFDLNEMLKHGFIYHSIGRPSVHGVLEPKVSK
jgi:UDPglucose 6-dehydrogenase